MVKGAPVFRRIMLREIARSPGRFIAIFLIVLLGVGFFCGMRITAGDMRASCDAFLDECHTEDVRVESIVGLSQADLERMARLPTVERAVGGYQFDALAQKVGASMQEEGRGAEAVTSISSDSGSPVRVLSISDEPDGEDVDAPRLVAGRLPQGRGECLAEPGVAQRRPVQIGERLTLSTPYGSREFLVTGIAQSPLFISYERGTNSLGSGTTLAYLFVTEADAASLALPEIAWPSGFEPGRFYTEARIVLKGSVGLDSFSPEYRRLLDDARLKLRQLGVSSLGSDRFWTIEDRLENRGVQGFQGDAERIGNLGKVFPLIFFLVAALVSLTVMTRLVEEKRGEIGTLMALGKRPSSVMGQYLWYAAAATFGGGGVGAAIGFPILPRLIYSMYRLMYYVGPLRVHYDALIAAQAILFSFLCTGGATFVAIRRELRSVPAVLMRPRSPKPGKRIFLEKVPALWNKMGFLRRITARNLFRYKSRLFMSIAGLAGCFGLLLTGFGMNDSLKALTSRQFGEIYHYDAMVLFASTNLAQSRQTLAAIQKTSGVGRAALLSIEGGVIRRPAAAQAGGAGGMQLDGYVVTFAEPDALAPFITLRDGGRSLSLADEGLILTRKAAALLGVTAGDEIELEVSGRRAVVRVNGVTDQYVMHFAYLSPKAYERAFGSDPIYNEAALIESAPLHTTSQATGLSVEPGGVKEDERSVATGERREEDLAGRLLLLPGVSRVSLTSADTKLWEDTMKNMRAIIAVIIVAAGLLTFIVIYTLTSINITERTKELATIKVLGFREHEVAQYIYRENTVLAALGICIGLVFGIFLHRAVVLTTEVDVCMFGRQISAASYALTLVLFSAFSFLANVNMAGRIRRIDMVEAMKSIE